MTYRSTIGLSLTSILLCNPLSLSLLSSRLRYRPHTQEKWRESLNGNYNVTQKSLGEGASGKVILAAVR
jgi:hypothetical protein